MLVTSIFSFSHSVFYSVRERNRHFSNVQFVVCKCFQYGHVQNFLVWQGLKDHKFLTVLMKKAFENIVGKREMLVIGIFSLFPQCSPSFLRQYHAVSNILVNCLEMLSTLVSPLICLVMKSYFDKRKQSTLTWFQGLRSSVVKPWSI